MNFCMYALVFVTPPDIDLLRFVAQRFTESFSEEANHDRLVPGGGGIWTSFVECNCHASVKMVTESVHLLWL